MDASVTTTPGAVADYEVVRLLGEGNHGRFWLARPPARLGLTDEYVALKVFGFEVGKGPAQVEECAEGETVVEDDRLGGSPNEVIADDHGACTPGDGPL